MNSNQDNPDFTSKKYDPTPDAEPYDVETDDNLMEDD